MSAAVGTLVPGEEAGLFTDSRSCESKESIF